MHIKHPEKYQTKPFHTLLERFCDYLLLGIENRGGDATGFVAFTTEGSMSLDKKDETASKWIKTRRRLPEHSRTVLLHTRFATKGLPEVWGNNHPVFAGDWFTVHNGTIYNDDELFEKHKIDRIAEVDSEIIPAMLQVYGADNADKAFAELTGGFATASVNLKNPKRTILAKGGSWPLVTLETKDILVFASTREAIQNAWGLSLGTPPKVGWDTLGSGDIWIVDGDRTTKKKNAFTHSAYRASNKTTSKSVGVATYADDWDEYDDGTWPYRGSGNNQFILDRTQSANGGRTSGANTVLDNRERVAALRKSGKGACVIYSQRLTPKGKAYLEKYGNNRWTYCVHCEVSVSDTQTIKDTKEYGTICVDCYTIAKVDHPEKDGNLVAFLADVGLREDDFESLVKFSDVEIYIHNQALYAIARATGVKRTIIDWLIHRADESVLEQSKELLRLYCDLSDMYVSKVMELWQEWSAESIKQEDDHPDPWITCASGTHRQSEECNACKAAEAECGASCGVSVFKGDEDDDGVVLYDSERPKNCLLCKRKPTYFLGLTHAWCTRHKSKCSVKGCKEVANHYDADGVRYCHLCSRGVKGLVADNDFKARKALSHA